MLRRLLRALYLLFFGLTKSFRYPSCTVETNFVLPGVKLGKGVLIRRGVKVYRNVYIGDHTFINEDTRIDPNTASIGKFCSISHNVKIGLGPHPLAFFTTSPLFYEKQRGLVNTNLYDEFAAKGYTRVGHDVFIAANAIIVAGVTIGHGAVVAAGSVVTRDVAPYAVVAGVPARVIRYRFDDTTIARLLASEWWNMDILILGANAHFGANVHAFLDAIEKAKACS